MIKARFDPAAFEKLDFTMKQLKRVVMSAHVSLDRKLRDRNPFDTGFSANSWWPAVDGAPASNPNTPATGGGDRGTSDPAVLLASIGHVLTLANSAPYEGKLNEGYSPQAPAGWIDAAANEYQDDIEAAILAERGKTK